MTKVDLSSQTFHNADNEEVEYDGSPVTWRVSAYVVIIKDDEIFLIKSSVEKLYDIPGGGIEMSETVEEALVREGLEEAGIQVKPGRLITAIQDYFYHRELKKYYKTIQLFYEGELVGEPGKPTDQQAEFAGWIKLSDLSSYPLPPGVMAALAKLGW